MGETTISWTDYSFNPWHGCVEVSPACDNCYARTFSRRVGYSEGSATKFPIWGKDAARRFFGDKHWRQPLDWNAKAEFSGVRFRAFCGSMCDVMEWREDLNEPRSRLYGRIKETDWIDWLLLTKRPQNFHRLLPVEWLDNSCPPNVWLMTTVEGAKYFWRIRELQKVPAAVRGLSMEPLLEKPAGLENHLDGIHWVITGGESGAHCRTSEADWFRYVRDICVERGIAFHHKQNGGLRPKANGCLLDGEEWKQIPVVKAWGNR